MKVDFFQEHYDLRVRGSEITPKTESSLMRSGIDQHFLGFLAENIIFNSLGINHHS